MIVIRIGLEQTPSGKILDGATQSYIITATRCEKEHALEYHDQTKKPIFVKVNGKAYHKITREQLINLPNKHGRT
jgi:hypothetical protein